MLKKAMFLTICLMAQLAMADQNVYDQDECIGSVVNGVCHGTILPNKAYHPTCHGEMLNGQCTGPMF